MAEYSYTEEQSRKAYFVSHQLKELLQAASRDDIEDVHYSADKDKEIVVVSLSSGLHRCIDITCDSLMAIVLDVMKSDWWR